jgi:Ala-tRNA(Pro) deacylase
MDRFMSSGMLPRCLALLSDSGISLCHSTGATASGIHGFRHPAEISLHDLAFTVVYHGDNQYGMLVLPADRIVEFWAVLDFGQVRKLMGLRQIRLASELELTTLFPDCDIGAVPPFGNFFDIPVLLEQDLAMRQLITFTIGTPRHVVRMNTADFQVLVKPVVGSFAARVNPSRGLRATKINAWNSASVA